MKSSLLLLSFVLTMASFSQIKKALPIIDMHLHALPANWDGPPPVGMCAPFEHWSVHDPKNSGKEYYENTLTKNIFCNGKALSSPTTDDSIMIETFKIMEQYNIYGVTSGPLVSKWKQSAPKRIIAGLMFSPEMNIGVEEMRQMFNSKSIEILGEVVGQYNGITLSDSSMDPYLSLAEDLDIPVNVHVGPGPPGIAYVGDNRYRAKFHSALVIEEALIKHPKLRVVVAHAGWPMIDDMIAVLYTHPQVYVDLGVLCYAFPKKEFYSYLQRLVDAGFEKRICFGSDQMIWPKSIEVGIETISNAPFLTNSQKRDIFFNNAARFLRLTEDQIEEYHK